MLKFPCVIVAILISMTSFAMEEGKVPDAEFGYVHRTAMHVLAIKNSIAGMEMLVQHGNVQDLVKTMHREFEDKLPFVEEPAQGDAGWLRMPIIQIHQLCSAPGCLGLLAYCSPQTRAKLLALGMRDRDVGDSIGRPYYQPLHEAVMHGHHDAVVYLLAIGAPVDGHCDEHRVNPPLSLVSGSCLRDKIRIIESLIDSKSDVNFRDGDMCPFISKVIGLMGRLEWDSNSGVTPVEINNLLVKVCDAGANVNPAEEPSIDFTFNNPLVVALKSKNLETGCILLRRGAEFQHAFRYFSEQDDVKKLNLLECAVGQVGLEQTSGLYPAVIAIVVDYLR